MSSSQRGSTVDYYYITNCRCLKVLFTTWIITPTNLLRTCWARWRHSSRGDWSVRPTSVTLAPWTEPCTNTSVDRPRPLTTPTWLARLSSASHRRISAWLFPAFPRWTLTPTWGEENAKPGKPSKGCSCKGKGEQTSQSYSEKLGSKMLPEIEQASNCSNKLHEANKLGNLISYTRQLFHKSTARKEIYKL